jgi:hypothetical protein
MKDARHVHSRLSAADCSVRHLQLVAFVTPGVSWTAQLAVVHMMSGQDWVLTWEDVLITFAILLLAVEIIKSTRIGLRTIIDHTLTMALFIAMLVEFLLAPQVGTSTFFLLLIICVVDVMVGFIIGIRDSQHQLEVQAEHPA